MIKQLCVKMLLLVCAASAVPVFAAPSVQGSTQTTQLQWYTDYQQAREVAKKEQKPMVLFFTGSDWCGWCKKMVQEVFDSPEFQQEVGGMFVFVDIDFPKNRAQTPELAQQNGQLKQKYGISGYPTLVVLDANENFIAEAGYRPGGGRDYAQYLKQLVR